VASAGLYASLRLIPDNHANIPPLSFLQAGCPSCRPTNSVNCMSSSSICCQILCSKILSTTFIACSNNLIPLYDPIHTPLGPLSLCKLVVHHLTSSYLECNLLSQYYYINPISTEFQYPLWLLTFLLLALTNLGLYVFSSFFQCCINFISR